MKRFKRKQKGIALFTVLVFVPILLLLMGSIIKAIISESYFLLREKRSEQAFYLAESGVDMAYHLLRSKNFGKFTHNSPTVKFDNSDFYYIGTPTYPGFDRVNGGTYDGWIRWKWEVGDTHESMCGSTYKEEFMFQIYPAEGVSGGEYSDFIIKVVGKLGYGQEMTKKIIVRGERPNLLEYAIFDNDDLSEFTRGAAQTISGKVHANGDIYLCPDGSTLKFKRDSTGVCSLTASGKIIAYCDIWGRKSNTNNNRYIDDPNGNEVLMTVSNPSVGWVDPVAKDELYITNPGKTVAYDSSCPEWADTNPGDGKGALDKWKGNVRDSSIGAQTINVPNYESFLVGGYYDQKASDGGLRIGSTGATQWNGTTTIPAGVSSAVTPNKTFANRQENRMETVVDIDVQKMLLGPDGYRPGHPNDTEDMLWPANGVIYAETPVRFINAQELPNPVTVISPYNIYVQSDFNMVYPTKSAKDANSSQKKAAALCSTSRIYALSKSWNDSQHATLSSGATTADDPSRYTGDVSGVVEINAAMIDGAPTVDERPFRHDWGGVTNPYYVTPSTAGSRSERTDSVTGDSIWANTDDLLENWSGKTLQKRGSIIHLQNSNMAEFDNSNVGPGVTAWITRRDYSPPTRNYGPDPSFAANAPPEFPRGGTFVSWQLVGAMDND